MPPPQEVLEMEPEELAPFILRHLKTLPENSINRHNYSLPNDRVLHEELGQRGYTDYLKRVMEAWMWLEREGFLAPRPGNDGSWMFVTRKGEAMDTGDLDAYRHSSLFPTYLDPILIRTVRPLFARGDYDTAVFRAFKEVETRVRKKGGYTSDDYGIDLMRKAFGPTGVLADKEAPKAEQDRTRELFVGAIGRFKNPSSHRDIKFEDPLEVIDMLSFANQLLRMVGRAT